MEFLVSDDKSSMIKDGQKKNKVVGRSIKGMNKGAEKPERGEGIRLDIVRELRKQIKNHSYEIKSGEIASRIANELFASTATFKGQVK
jgi:anti-sigma28 factor (negative regulator of flagellin synthesis)